MAATFDASERQMDQLRAVFADAARAGELHPSAASDEAPRLFTIVLSGLISQQMANEPGADYDTGSFTRLTDTAFDMFFARYAPPGELPRGSMIDHSPVPENFVPCELLLRTAGSCEIEPERLLQVFGEQRERFVAVLRGFGADDWAAPTRCADWSAHDVVRHLCDTSTYLAGTRPGDRRLDIAAGFDPRITPRQWATAPAGESRDATLRRFITTTEEMLGQLRGWLAQDRRFDVHLPYGLMDWKVLVLHVHWDSWLHERDVLLAQDREHPTDDDATFYATAYGVFIAAAVAPIFGDQVQEKLTLGGDGGGVFDVENGGAATLAVTRMVTAGAPAAQVTDALAGRSAGAAVLSGLSAGSRTALLRMADFFNSPVAQSPA
jgi:uncharacterized protein (TIGR03083 family)